MTVILHSDVEGRQVGDEYTGVNEQYLVENGLAKKKVGTYNGVFTGVAYDHSDDPEQEPYEATPSTDGYVPPVDESLIVNGDEIAGRDYQHQTYGAANGTPDGELPAVSDPWVDPFADERDAS